MPPLPTCQCGECPRCKKRVYMRGWYQGKSVEERRAWTALRDPEKVLASEHARYERDRDKRIDAMRDRERARRAGSHQPVSSLMVLERDDGACGICGEDVDPVQFHIDHIIPLAFGGIHHLSNLQVAHPFCNLSKGDSF